MGSIVMIFRSIFLVPAIRTLLFVTVAPAAVMLSPAISMAQTAPTLVQQLQAELAYQLAEAAEYSTPTYHTYRAQHIVKQLAVALAAQAAGNPLPPQLNESGQIMQIRGTVCGAACQPGGVPLPPPGGGVVIAPSFNETAGGQPSSNPDTGIPSSNPDGGQVAAGPVLLARATILLPGEGGGHSTSGDGAAPKIAATPSASAASAAGGGTASSSPKGDSP